MKKHKFKLEALLKMRKLEEDQCKMRIGRLQTEKTRLLEQIDKQNQGIDEAYSSQEQSVKNGATGMDLRFYPYFVQGKRAATKELERKIADLDTFLEDAYKDLKQYRAKAKVLEEMKEKDRKAHKKQTEKEMHQKIEEQVMNWTQFKKQVSG